MKSSDIKIENHRVHSGHREKLQLSVLSVCSEVDIPFIDSPQSEPELVFFREWAPGQPVKGKSE